MYFINVMDEKTNLRYKLTAWLLVLCLVVTLIPDIGFAAGAEEKNNTEEKTVQQPSEGNVEKKTADTTTYDLGCGKHMTVFHGGQVRYKTENGKLQDYDPSLVRIKKGSKTENNVSLENYVYENKQGDKKHYLPEVLSEETPIIMEKGDCSVRFTPSNETLESLKAENASPHIKKEKTETLYESEKTVPASAVYKSEDKNVEIKYTSGDRGIKETITLNEKPESNVLTYIFELENMTARKNPTNEGITFYDLSGEDIKGAVEAPWMNDASGKAYSEDITYDIEKLEGKNSRYLLTMTVDKDYLESEDRQYPVTIDPTTTWKGNDKLRDVYVISGSKYGDENFYAEGTNVMPAGKNSTGVHRTYIKFIDLRAAVLGKNVTSAKLTVYEKGDGNTGQKVSAYKVKKSWGQSTLTWNNKPANETTALATVSASGTAKKERTFTLTNFVKSLAGGSVSNYGIVLKNTTDSPGYASFYGSRNTSTSYRPKLAVTYTDTPATAESASVSPRYVKDSTNATLTYTGLPASALARVEYKIIEYDEAASTAGDTVVDFSENTAISSGDKLPYLEEGCYRVYVRGVNSAGTAGNAKSAGLVRVDRTKPEVGSVTFEDSSGNAITDEFTEESDPVINFSGADDTYLETSGIKYALVPKGTTAAGTDFKAAASLTVNDTKPYSGSFRFTEEDQAAESGSYTLSVKFEDRAGNAVVKKFTYNKDNEDPAGSITITNLITGNEESQLYQPVNVELAVSGTGSEIKESSLKLYKATTDSTGMIVNGIEEDSEVVLAKNFTMSKNIVVDPFELCDQSGMYRLILYLKDSVGRTKQIKKDVEVVYQLPPPDEASLSQSKGGTAVLTWRFSYNAQHKIKLGSFIGRFGNSGEWEEIVSPGKDGKLPFAGSAEIEVPDEEGIWDLNLKSVDSKGNEGGEFSVKCVVDKTAPSVNLSSCIQGHLKGNVTDDNFKEWKLYAKEKSAAEYGEEAIKSGKHDTDEHNNEITFVDFTKEPFETGGEYTLKLIAEDKAGNKGEGTLDVTVPSDGTAARLIGAGIQIDKGDRPEDVTGFIIPADQQELKLKDNAGTAEWYVAGSRTSPQLKDADGNSTIGEDTWQEILAVKNDETSGRKYSVDVLENGEKKSVNYTSSQISGSTGTKEISFTNNAVSFRIKAQPRVATYKVRAETASGSGSYVTVQPDTTYYVSDITDSAAYTRVFTVKATAQSGKNLNDSALTIYADTMQPEFFLYSNIEIYAAGNLTVEDKINFKSYLKWDIPGSLPDNISYEVYRGDKPDFDYETEGTLIASDIKAGYFALINAWSGKDLYYKVCAVKKHTDGSLLYRSTFSEECAGRAADLNESLKHLGMKDYWEFAEFDTPNGSGYIEKSSGNFLYQQKDAELPNEGFDVKFTRTYNSKSSIRGNLGTGWSHEYDIELLDISEDDALKFTHVILKDGNGTIYHFTRKEGEEQFRSSFGRHANLTAETTEKEKTVKISANSEDDTTVTLRYQFILYTKDGIKYYFNSGGQLILMEENNGSFVIFEHDAKKGVLSAMRTNNDITAQFIYCDGTDGTDPLTVKEVRLPDGSRVEYEYTKPAFTSEQLLTKVSEVSGSERIEYEYEYDKPLLSTQPRNLTVIKDAENKNKYEIKYDFENDQVKEAVYPNGEKFTFEYDEDGRYTVTKKHSGGEAVLAEKDFFDVISGECEKSIRGIDDETVLTASGQEGLDITTYEYIDNKMVSSTQTAEYHIINDSGYVVKQNGIKTNKISYSGDDPVKETEDDGTVSEYTYYTEEDGENLDEQIKTVKETNADGRMTGHTKYSYDSLGNVTETIEYVEGTKTVNTYYTEGVFKGELKSMTESLIRVSDTYEILSESVQSRSVYTYAYGKQDGKDVKTESCSQTIYKADGSEDTVVSGNIYDMMGRLIEETDSRGYKTINTYDGFGRVTATTYKYSDSNQLKQSTTKEYDKNGNVTHEVLEDGIEKRYTYDNMGQVTSVTVRKGDGQEEKINTTYRYQDVEIYQGKGDDTVTVKNAYVTKETYADGTIVSETYEDHKGNIVRSYQDGLYTDMTYSIQGDMLTKWSMGQTLSADEGLLEIYIYDDNGNLTSTITDPDYIAAAGTTGYHLRADAVDDNGSIVQGSIVSSSTYDADGNAVTQTDALGNTNGYRYDKEGNLLAVTLPDATEYEYQYDVMDSSGDSKTTKDIVIEPREIWQGGVKVNTTSRSVVTKDSADRTVKVEDLGTSETDGTSISTAYEYDSRDNLTKSIDKNGNYREYSYDSRDRLTTVEYYERRNDSAVKTLKTAYTYDDADNMTSMTDMDIKEGQEEIYRYTAYSYDDFNRLISVSECDTDSMPSDTVINANKIIYSYDGKDRLVSISYPDAALGVTGLEFIYNIHGWLTEVKAEGTNVFSRTIREYTYTADGKVDEITDYTDFQSGLTGTSRWLKRSYGYDKLNRTVSIEYTDNMSSGNDIREAHYYKYDKNSNITEERTVNAYGSSNGADYEEICGYSYDDLNHLVKTDITKKNPQGEVISSESNTYEYDAAGNKTRESVLSGTSVQSSTDYRFNEFNQLISSVKKDEEGSAVSSKAYTYDLNGNQTKEIDSITGEEADYKYDADNRLSEATGRTGETVDYEQDNKYNGFGQRIRKKEGSDETNYFYDGTAVLYTEDGNGETTTFNLIGTEDNILFTARPAEEEETSFYSYTRDLRESTINLVGSDGSSVRSYSYDDFGETKVMGSGDFCNEVCYGAGIYDDTTGLYYLNARYYDPDTGNFLTQDTYRGSRSRTETLNLYGYCAGNPINYTDPSGHWIWGIIGAASGAYDGYKYAKKKKYKGWRKAAAIAGGAALGAVNPFKVFKAARTGYRAYKACKYAKKARSYVKKGKALKKIKLKARHTKITKKKYKVKRKPKVVRTSKKTIKKLQRKAKATIKVSKYKVLKKSTSENGQAHHLNQDAAFKDVIPHNEGLAVELQGNAITDIGSPHYKAHAELERFWNNYRKNGELYDQEVKIGDYNKAVYDSLVEAGLSKPDAAYAVERAYRQQRQYGLINSGNVPRLPGRLTQKKI